MTSGRKSLTTKLGGFAAAATVKAWMSTLDLQCAMYDPTVDPLHDEFRGPIIGIILHEYLAGPFFLRGHTNSAILTSRHRDAEWLAEASRYMGFLTIRGSTARGGSRALLEMMRISGTKNVGIAADGPLGPRRQLAPGPIYLSSKLQIPLVAYAMGYDRPWRLSTWDRFAVPRPGSRGRLIIGPRMQIPANLSREQLEHYRRHVQEVLLRLTCEAEAWAEAGTRKLQQCPVRRRTAGPLRVTAPFDLRSDMPITTRRAA